MTAVVLGEDVAVAGKASARAFVPGNTARLLAMVHEKTALAVAAVYIAAVAAVCILGCYLAYTDCQQFEMGRERMQMAAGVRIETVADHSLHKFALTCGENQLRMLVVQQEWKRWQVQHEYRLEYAEMSLIA